MLTLSMLSCTCHWQVEQEFLDKCEPRMEQLKMYAERQLPHIGELLLVAEGEVSFV